jgi:alpha-glucoside transport system substrate-binding protein
MISRRTTRTALVTVAVAGLASGCLSSGSDSGGDSGGAQSAKKEIEIMFGFGGDQTQGFKDSLDPFAKANGLTIKYTQSDSFDTLIRTRVAGNDLPDIALFPQPGLLKDIQKTGKMAALDDQLDMAKLQSSIVPGFLDAAKVDGKTYGVPVSMNIKSLLFYNKKAYEAKGYTQPKTLDELQTLSEKIKADGTAPFCVGYESGGATGWVGTDWIEDLVLKELGPDKYDQWVKNELKFDSPEIKGVFGTFDKLVLADGQTYGGRKSIVSTAFSTAANPMFDNPPKCYLHHQGNFVTQKGFLPDAIWNELDANVGVFPMPKGQFDTVLGGGDLAAMFTKNDTNVLKVMKEITENPKFGEVWAGPGDRGFLSPHKDFDTAKYGTEITKSIAQIAYTASGIRFDGSDAMPGAVGAGSFWKGMVAYTSGQQDVDATLKSIDESWPTS